VVWAVTVVVGFIALITFLIYASRKAPPDDALALELAVELGAAQPELVEERFAQWWKISLPGRTRIEVYVSEGSVWIRRPLERSASHAATVLPASLFGRDQEMYQSRTLVPSARGGFEIGGAPGTALLGWELRLPPQLPEAMRELGITYLRVERGELSTGVAAHGASIDATLIDEVAHLLDGIVEVLPGDERTH